MTKTITLTERRVIKDVNNKTYQVFELQVGGILGNILKPVSKEYRHSTSAFAALGRLVQKETLATLNA